MSELKNLSAILEGGAVPAGYNGKAIGKLSKTYLKLENRKVVNLYPIRTVMHWKSHATLTLLATQDLPTFGYNMIDPLKSWCWGSILFYPFKISRFS